MVTKTFSTEPQGGPPPLDESWWTALLAEEEKPHQPHRSEKSHKTHGRASTSKRPKSSSKSTGSLPVKSKKETHLPQIDWEKTCRIYRDDESIDLKVTGFNRGGLLVEGNGIQGFVPVSHIIAIPSDASEEEREQLLAGYIDRSLMLKIIECIPEQGRIVFSERAALAEPGRRTQLLESLAPGDLVQGTVTNITDFGAYVDLGGLEGLIHVSEISWGRVRHPSDSLRLGEIVQVCVLGVDDERARVALSLKRLCPNPWETALERYSPGQLVEAVITAILPFGAFARVEDGLDGLIHVSEMGEPGESLKPADLLEEGQAVMVRIVHIEPTKQRMGLSLQLKP
jgi:small subunit ribosomal protein S1